MAGGYIIEAVNNLFKEIFLVFNIALNKGFNIFLEFNIKLVK